MNVLWKIQVREHCRLLPAGVVPPAAAALHAVRMELSFAVECTVVAIYSQRHLLLYWKLLD